MEVNSQLKLDEFCTIIPTNLMNENKSYTPNSTYPKSGVSCSIDPAHAGWLIKHSFFPASMAQSGRKLSFVVKVPPFKHYHTY